MAVSGGTSDQGLRSLRKPLPNRLNSLQVAHPAVVAEAVNPNRTSVEDGRTPEELLDVIEAKGREIDATISELRASLRPGS